MDRNRIVNFNRRHRDRLTKVQRQLASLHESRQTGVPHTFTRLAATPGIGFIPREVAALFNRAS